MKSLIEYQSSGRKCSRCGKIFDMYDDEENFCFDRYIGYGSKYDLKHIKFNLCCDCFDKIFDIVLPIILDIEMEDYN